MTEISADSAIFRRIILGMHRGSPESAAIRAAAQLAELLRLEFVGLFAQDPSVLGLAALPFGRELRSFEREWRPLTAAALAEEMEAAARRAQRMFAETAAALRVTAEFQMVKAPIAETIEAAMRLGDIVAVPAPASPMERITQQFSHLLQAAFRSAGAVLVVPADIARQTGSVVALVAGPDDPGARLARAIATAAKEQMVLIEVAEGTRRLQEVPPQLGRPSERLLVLARDLYDEALVPAMACARRVPVLVVDSDTRNKPQSAPAERKAS
jgi:hypothetical protein